MATGTGEHTQPTGPARLVTRGTLAVLTKEPVPGKVKTRLAASLGTERAAALASAFLEDTLDLVRDLAVTIGVQVVVFVSPTAAQAAMTERCRPRGLDVAPQVEGDRGRRIAAAIESAFERGGPVIAISSDSPDLPAELVKKAFDELARSPAVLGPCPDGGYHLIGLADRRAIPCLLGPIAWSTARALEDTRTALVAHGCSPTILASHADVDDLGALAALEARLRSGATRAPATARALGLIGSRA